MMYAELHCKTPFSFLEGASHAEQLWGRAAELGYTALAVTDRNTLAGIVRAHTAARQTSLKLIVGAEITPCDAPSVVLWATDRAAYGRLSRLITVGRRRADKGDCHLTWEDVAAHAQGLLAGVIPALQPLPQPGQVQHTTTFHENPLRHRESCLVMPEMLQPYKELFGDRCYLLAELHRGVDDQGYLEQLETLANTAQIPLVAAGDVHYHVAGRMVLHDALTAIRHNTTVAAIQGQLFANAQHHLRTLEEISLIFESIPEALQHTCEIADRCQFSLDELRYEYPEELAPHGQTPLAYLQRLTWQGARMRYRHGIPDKVRQLLTHELQLIGELQYEAYFLTVWDLVRFARLQGILCQGRGSAANSAVCYCLGITAVDPDQTDVLFERFVSRERNEAPDIDVDFEHERREEVLQYLYNKYGRQRAGMTAEVIRYRTRSAIRDVGKALGLSLDRVDALAQQVEGSHHEPLLTDRCRQVGIDPDSSTGQRLVYLVNQLVDFPRHLSQHVGGMVITQGPLCELVPVENAAMEGRTVIQWDKNDLDELGILKIDCLALGMLTAIGKCFALILQHTGRQLTLSNIPEEDEQVYQSICQADTMGVFQIESRAQMSMLPRLKPRCYYDLVIEVAIVRPGPIQGNMVHPYLRRRAGKEPVIYPNESVRQVLKKTLGVPIFQEQAMRLAVVAAGFTPGEADQLRRAMGAWRRPGIIDKFRQKLVSGMLGRGFSREFAEQVFRQIRGFGEYGFPESHAASFALLVYVSAWLKVYHPDAFIAALLNSQPMGFYAPAQLVRDARDHGVPVRPIDVNFSDWDCTLEKATNEEGTGKRERAVVVSPHALRLGMRMITGLSHKNAKTIKEVRCQGRFRSITEFTRRTGMNRTTVIQLARADAFTSVEQDRRGALWEALSQEQRPREMPLLENLSADDERPAGLEKAGLQQEVYDDYRTTGLSLKQHPIAFHRVALNHDQIVPAKQLASLGNQQLVRVAGLVLLRQRPSTAKGITFVTLEDETGTANLVLHQRVWERYYTIARRSPAWIVSGKLEHSGDVIHVVVNRLEDLSGRLNNLKSQSRDFR